MKNKFPERKRLRHKDFDYSNPGYYFITICSEGKEEIFGRIEKGKMILNDTGKIIDKYWNSIPDHFPDIELDQFQIMPDHLHTDSEIILPFVRTGFRMTMFTSF